MMSLNTERTVRIVNDDVMDDVWYARIVYRSRLSLQAIKECQVTVSVSGCGT